MDSAFFVMLDILIERTTPRTGRPDRSKWLVH
jgi:hypothetical protein